MVFLKARVNCVYYKHESENRENAQILEASCQRSKEHDLEHSARREVVRKIICMTIGTERAVKRACSLRIEPKSLGH